MAGKLLKDNLLSDDECAALYDTKAQVQVPPVRSRTSKDLLL